MKLEVVRGSIVEFKAEAIVNAANTRMRGGGGLDGAIHRAAGPKLLKELEAKCPNGTKTSEVVVTLAHEIETADVILHVAGPIYQDGLSGEPAQLAACYLNCLKAAEEEYCISIALPSISTGIYRYPLEDAAKIALETVRSSPYFKSHGTISFVMFGAEEFEVYQRTLNEVW